MPSKIDFFLDIAKKNMSRFCFMIWDYFQCPEIFDIEVYDDSLLCKYEHHALVFGEPKEELLKRFNPIGETSISYDPEWFPIIERYFTNFSLLDPSAEGKNHNTFLCMELTQDCFEPKENPMSRILSSEEYKLLEFRKRILFSSGLGGVGIIQQNRIVGRAFTPHVVEENNLSYAIVRDVFVDTNFRNRGYGYDLSSKICEVIFENNIEKVVLWVEESNSHAVRIYEKLGFLTTDKVRSNYCIRKEIY